MDELTKNLLALLSSGDVDSVRIEAVVKRRPNPPPYTPVISLVFGPDFDPNKSEE